MLHATAFCPANISLVFETYPAEPPHGRGSLGVGITLDSGVTVRVSRLAEAGSGTPHRILVSGGDWEFPTVRGVLTSLGVPPLRVEIDAAFPFGCGFGMSGASALATAEAADCLLGLKLPRSLLGMAAHEAEVNHATGLGDVGGQFNGGIMIKTRRHHPLSVEQLPIPPQTLHWRIHGPIRTADVINSPEKLRLINAAGHRALKEITSAMQAVPPSLTMASLFDLSHTFALDSGLLRSPAVAADINAARAAGHSATMIMLGDATVSTGPFPGSRPAGIHFPGNPPPSTPPPA